MNLRQVRKKIKSVSNVKKITKAMQLVSAVKMKKAQTVAIQGRPYRSKLEELFYRILPSIDPSESVLLSAKENALPRELVVLITSNKDKQQVVSLPFMFKHDLCNSHVAGKNRTLK